MSCLLPARMSDGEYGALEEAKTFWSEMTNEALQPENLSEQACWDSTVYEGIFKQLLEKQTAPAEKARLLAVS